MGLSSFADTIKCKDGFQMCIQAGRMFESSPRNNIGPWTEFEVEIPFDVIEVDLIPYSNIAMYWHYDSNTFFNVPKEVVKKIITKHGGIKDLKVGRLNNSSLADTKVVSLKTFLLINDILDLEKSASLSAPQYKKTGLKWGM